LDHGENTEARGEVRGGRFVSGFAGEQFAMPEAVESLRAARHSECAAVISVAAADPTNLAGIVLPGEKVPSVPGRQVLYRNGCLHEEQATAFEGERLEMPSSAVFSSVAGPPAGLFQQ